MGVNEDAVDHDGIHPGMCKGATDGLTKIADTMRIDRLRGDAMGDSKKPEQKVLERREFLQKGALAGAAAIVGSTVELGGQSTPPSAVPASPTPVAPTTPIMTAAGEAIGPGEVQVLRDNQRSGSDFMVDVLKALGFEYVAANPGSSFRGLHESIINYGGNKSPELITCMHEESAVAMAHGYYKAEGKPMLVAAHGTVGLQHASMALYNAWCDRVPVYMVIGNYNDAAVRRPAEWYHGVQDAALMVRDFTKWDDTPWSLPHFAESAVRAYNVAVTPPMAPVVLVLDGILQEDGVDTNKLPAIPKTPVPAAPQGDSASVEQTARMLVAAESPVLVVA